MEVWTTIISGIVTASIKPFSYSSCWRASLLRLAVGSLLNNDIWLVILNDFNICFRFDGCFHPQPEHRSLIPTQSFGSLGTGWYWGTPRSSAKNHPFHHRKPWIWTRLAARELRHSGWDLRQGGETGGTMEEKSQLQSKSLGGEWGSIKRFN